MLGRLARRRQRPYVGPSLPNTLNPQRKTISTSTISSTLLCASLRHNSPPFERGNHSALFYNLYKLFPSSPSAFLIRSAKNDPPLAITLRKKTLPFSQNKISIILNKTTTFSTPFTPSLDPPSRNFSSLFYSFIYECTHSLYLMYV
eukprot:Phypoly_transcript_14431.p2 GENE.Phypoly_transcript_14431~~Phypoly_transcript_14431.p2  ORF type:complete len:146 (+),score=22.11 Phypoly_transcript_14431:505-942(+)